MANDLVAKLGTDNAAWDAGFKRAQSTASSFASGFTGILAPLAAGLGGIWGAASSVGAYKESLEAQRKLSAVIEATGGAAGLTTSQITDFAGEMQSLTNFEDDATTAAAATLAAFTNIRGQTFTDTIEGAMNLSTVMGGDLQSNVKLLGKALNDPVNGLAKLTKAGVSFTDSQKEQIASLQKSGDLLGAQEVILGAVESKFGGAAMAVADPWTQLQNTLGDVAENIGSLLLPSINVLSEGVTALLGPVVDAGDAFLEFGIETAVMLSNMGGMIALALDQWTLFFVQIGLEASHVFTDVLPAYVQWFGDNFVEMVVTYTSNVLTTYENLGKNIMSIWRGVLDFFSTGTFKVDFTPITDGFINTVSALPDVAPRIVTEFEKGLQASIASQTEALGESITAERERLTKMFDTESKVPDSTLVDDAEASGGKEKKKKEGDNKAALIGSAEAAKLALGGGANKLEDLAAKSLKEQQRTNEKLDALNEGEDNSGSDIP